MTSTSFPRLHATVPVGLDTLHAMVTRGRVVEAENISRALEVRGREPVFVVEANGTVHPVLVAADPPSLNVSDYGDSDDHSDS